MTGHYTGNDLLEDLAKEYRGFRKQWREERNVPSPRPDDVYAQNRERIEELKQVLFRIINDKKIIGEAMLASIWSLYKDELWRYDSQEWDEQPNSFSSYMEMAILQNTAVEIDSEDRRYFNAMRSVVENIFSVVYNHERSGNSILDENGSPITVDRLISTRGLISKLKEWSFRIGTAENDEEQRALIGAVATRTRSQLDELRGEMDQLPTIELIVSVEQDGYTIAVEHLDSMRFELLKRLLGRYGKVRFS